MQDTSPTGDADGTRPRVSIRFVLFVVLGVYLAGFGMYRLNNEPPSLGWRAFRLYHNPTLSDYLQPFQQIWESDGATGMKVFHTLYSPCYIAEEWLMFGDWR